MQDERGQAVVASGPYRYVRHPMYSTAIVFLAASGLLMGSFYALLPRPKIREGHRAATGWSLASGRPAVNRPG